MEVAITNVVREAPCSIENLATPTPSAATISEGLLDSLSIESVRLLSYESGTQSRRPARCPPERCGSLIFGDGGHFPNLFFYNSVGTRGTSPFPTTLLPSKLTRASHHDLGHMSYMTGASRPPAATTASIAEHT